MEILKLIGIFILGYGIGNFSPAYMCGRIVGKFDIRERGSGNAGTTNVIRLMGWRCGAVVFLMDGIKGILAAWLGSWLGADWGILAAAFGVVLGHDFPVFLNFRGGKGIASTAGIFLFVFALPTLAAVLVFAAVVLITRMVSMGSLVFVVCMLAYVLISRQPLPIILMAGGLGIFAFARHAENIQRIQHGEENKLSLRRKK